MLKLGTVVMGATDVERAATFWSEALGYRIHVFEDSANGFTILIPPDDVGTRVALQRAETPVQDRPRVHVDLVVNSPTEQQIEVERLIGLGGSHVDWEYPEDPDFVVVADTEGNRFCVVDASFGS